MKRKKSVITLNKTDQMNENDYNDANATKL